MTVDPFVEEAFMTESSRPTDMHVSRQIGTRIDRAADEVYAFAADPANLPRWASGLGAGVEFVDWQWVADSPMGRVIVAFAPPNDFGVLDHDVTLPDGTVVTNPMRVLPLGDDAAEVVFTLRRQPGQSDEDVEQDAATVAADLATLKSVLERVGTQP